MRYMAFEMGESGWNLFVCWKFIDTFIPLRVWKTCVVIESFRCFVGWRSRVVCFHHFCLSFPGWMHISINFVSFPLFDDAHILFSLTYSHTHTLSISVFRFEHSPEAVLYPVNHECKWMCKIYVIFFFLFVFCVCVFFFITWMHSNWLPHKSKPSNTNAYTHTQTNAAAITKDKSQTIRQKCTHARN